MASIDTKLHSRTKRSLVLSLSGAAVAALALGGCGLSTSGAGQTTHGQLVAARQAGARHARMQQKLHRLHRQVSRARFSARRSAPLRTTPQAVAAPAPAPAPTPVAPPTAQGAPAPSYPSTAPSGATSCGDGLGVEVLHTTCAFAENVRAAYEERGGGNIDISAYSPAMNRSYELHCTESGSGHVCTTFELNPVYHTPSYVYF
jgi:hypothetical protein